VDTTFWHIVWALTNCHFISNKDDWADWCSSNSLRLKLEVCLYLFETEAWHCRGFPQSLQTKAGTIPWLGQECFLPNPFYWSFTTLTTINTTDPRWWLHCKINQNKINSMGIVGTKGSRAGRSEVIVLLRGDTGGPGGGALTILQGW
jgi:hypothetical protein